jgi:translocation and assembly module TamB
LKIRWALRFLFFVVGSYLAVAMVLRTEWAASQICSKGAGLLSRLLQEPVVLTECVFDPWRTQVAVEGIRFGAGVDQFSAERLEVRFSPFSLGRSFGISQVRVVGPKVALDLRGGGEAAPPGAKDGCLEPLQRYPVDWASIQDASLSLYLPGGQLLELEDVGVLVSKEGRAQRVELRVDGGRWIAADAPPVELESLTGKLALDVAEARLDVESLSLSALGSTVSVDGAVHSLCAPRLGLRSNAVVDLAQVAARFAPDVGGVAGIATVGAALQGPVGDLRGDAILGLSQVTVEGYEPGNLSAGLRYGGGTLTVRDLVWPVGDGRAIVDAEVELSGDLPVVAEVRTEGLDFHRLMTRLTVQNTPVMMAVDSVHNLEGQLLGGLRLQGTSHLELRNFRVRTAPWHHKEGTVVVEVPAPAILEGRVRIDPAGVHLAAARASFGSTQLELDAHLFFDEVQGMRSAARSQAFHLEDVRSHVAGVPVHGVGAIEAEIAGPYSDPLIEARIDLAEAGLYSATLGRLRAEVQSHPAHGDLKFRKVEGQVAATPYQGWVDLQLGGDAAIEGAIQLPRGGRLEQAFGAARELLSPLAWLEEQVKGRIESLEATFRGTLPDLEAQGRIEVSDAWLLDRPFDSLEAVVRLPDLGSLHVDSLELRQGEGVATGAATFHFPQGAEVAVDAGLQARGLPIRELLGDFGDWAELEGEVEADLRIAGPIDHLDVRGSLHGTGLAARGVELAPTHLSLETQGDQVVVRGAVVGAGTLSASIRLADGLPFDASLALQAPRLAELLPTSFHLDGRLRGQATAVGSLAELSAASGAVVLDELVLDLAGYRVESPETVRLRFDGPALHLQRLDLRGENTSLSLAGGRTQQRRLDFQAEGTFDARLIGSFLPELEHPSGVVSVLASVTGTAERPVLVGSGEIRRGSFRFRDLPLHIQGLSGDLAFSQNQVVIRDATLTANGGDARVEGSVSLRGFQPDVLDLLFDVRGVSWRMPADWPAVGSGRIALTGRWTERLLVSGEARIDRLRWLKDLDLEKAILDFRRKAEVAPPADAREFLRFDLDLVGGSDMRVDSSHVRARLQFVGGRLRLVGSNVHPGLLGSVEVLDGVAFFRGNEYRVANGMVDFRERDRIDPAFDLTAETEVRDVRISAHAWGKLEDFQVDLQADPVLAQADILTLLTFGITSRDLDTGGGSAFSGASLAAEALLTVSGLDEHVKRWLPRTPLLMDPDLSVTSQYSELTGQMEPMAVFEARVFTDRLKLSAAAPFATNKGRRAAAEVRVSDHLSGQLSWQNEAVGYSSGDLGLDLKLRWEWE